MFFSLAIENPHFLAHCITNQTTNPFSIKTVLEVFDKIQSIENDKHCCSTLMNVYVCMYVYVYLFFYVLW